MKKLICCLSLFLLAQAAQAICTRADFTGTWRMYTALPYVARCTLIIPATGTAISASSTCVIPGIPALPVKGTLTMGTDCHVTGSIAVSTNTKSVDGWLGKGKDSFAGIGWTPGNASNGATISGVKQ